MMNAGVVGPGAGSDTVSVSKTSAKGDSAEGKSGFLDALTSHESGKKTTAKPGNDASNLDENDAGRTKPKRGNWMLENPPATRAPRDQAVTSETQNRDAAAGLDRLNAGRKKSADSDNPKDDLAELLSVKASHGKAGGKTGNGKVENNTAAGAVAEETAETTEKAAAGKGEGALNDVLSLLNGAAAANAAAGEKPVAKTDSRRDAAVIRGDVAGGRDLAQLSGDDSALPADVGAGDAVADANKTFRFARADGRGQTMDMTISGGKGDRAELATRGGGTGQAEMVTVVDARRYLGFEQGSNAGAVINSLSSDPDWHGAMQSSSALSNAAAWTSTGKVVNTLKIQMNPIELGLVTATMRLRGEELTVELTVETRAAYRQLSEDQRKIVDALKAQGFAVDQVSIVLSNVDRSDAANSQNGSQGQTFGQQASQGGGGGNSSTGPGAGDADRQQERNRGMVADDTVAEKQSGAATISGGGRPGHVYI